MTADHAPPPMPDRQRLLATARGLGRRPDPARALSYPEGEHAHLLPVEDHSFWFAHRNRCLVELLARHPPPGPLLDIGAGNGFVTRGLEQAGHPSIALEPSPAGAANARARGLDPVVCATLEEADFAPGSIPAAGLFDVLEHIEDRARLLLHLRERLTPDGRLYLTVPALGWLWSSEDVRAGHFLRYTRRSLRRELEDAGFRVESMRYFFGYLVLPVLFARVWAERLGLRRSSAEALARDLAPPHPGLRAAVDAVGAVERALLRMGAGPGLGTSLLAVATPR